MGQYWVGAKGIFGRNPISGSKVSLPIRYQYSTRQFLVDFVAADSIETARQVGKMLEEQITESILFTDDHAVVGLAVFE